MKIVDLLKCYTYPKCDNCKKECQGHLDYNNLCSNLNYLDEYGEKNYEKNKQSFIELKNIIKNPTIFSFGCGLGLDYFGANEIFDKDFKYFGIDECKWAIAQTNQFKKFLQTFPNIIDYKTGMFLLKGNFVNPVVCFFNSLFTISNNSNLFDDLYNSLKSKDNFCIVCDYTINNNYHMPNEEQTFLDNLCHKLKSYFSISQLKILEGKGIIVVAKRK